MHSIRHMSSSTFKATVELPSNIRLAMQVEDAAEVTRERNRFSHRG